MERVLRYVLYVGLLVFSLAAGIMGGVVLDRKVLQDYVPLQNIPENARSEFELMGEAWNTIQRIYVDRSALVPKNLAYGAIAGMVDALGDTGHSRFMSPEVVKSQNRSLQGEFEGIGAQVGTKDGHTVIIAPFDGSPAQKAGLKPGDIISAVNGVDVSALSLSEVVDKILGPAGTQVVITITDPVSGESRDVTITRAKIVVNNVTWQQIPGTSLAHVRISSFSQGVTEDLKKALQDIQKQKLSGVILDLRNNPGGLLDEGVGVASQFLTVGNVLQVKDADGNVKATAVKAGGVAPNIPLAVLINQGSASASEIVSGALQDAGRGKLIGETTFGTGTVLSQYNLSDGSALLLANQEWLTPKGRVIWHKGIVPDIEVKLADAIFPLSPEAERSMTADQLQKSQDSQLLKAIEVLTSQTQP